MPVRRNPRTSTAGSRARRRFAVPALALAALAAPLAGCTVEAQPDDGVPAGTSPFTGEEAAEDAPVVAVKVDNAPAARPHTGLEAADVVFVEPVEAGLSRLVAVYSDDLPERVGPVRSARESDVELLEQFDRPALAYSGVQERLRPVLEDAPLVAVAEGQAPEAYTRGAERAAPHNLYVAPAALLAAAPEAGEAADVGFRFGDAPADGGEPAGEHTVSYANASFTFTWSEAAEEWRIATDGEPTEATAGTVVVQHTRVRDSEYHDGSGAVTPYTETVGSGTAEVLRDGQRYPAEWSRPTASAGTEYTTPEGEPLRFATGPVWVVFAEE